MPEMSEIKIWNRGERREETERVYGDGLVKLVYGTGPGRLLADHVLAGKALSRAYGAYQSSAWSARKIDPFVREFGIRMEEYEDVPYRTFNEFFVRRFRPRARPFAAEAGRLPAFAEARYLAYERLDPAQTYPVKGSSLTAAALLGSEERARPFVGGAVVIARLCPVDYHRYHYPDDGRTLERYTLHGKLHSVNPLALRFRDEIFVSNERRVALLETARFGRLAYIEVGALCVGRIVQTYPEDKPFARGDEKGYFLFGASTVIVLGEPGKWKPDSDLLEQTARKRETFVKLGEAIAGAS
jgi:phosphatidylserine decarboxylase